MTALGFTVLVAAAALPTQGRFDLICTGSIVEALGTQATAPAPWTGRLSIDLGRGMAHRDEEQENLRMPPGSPGRLNIQDETKGFGDAVTRAEAHVDRATRAYSARSSAEVGGALLSQTSINAGCTVVAFTALAAKDAPAPIPEPELGRPAQR